MTHPVTQYALDVVAGKIVAGPDVRNECQRHLNDLKRDDVYFDEEAADRFKRFCAQELRLVAGDFEGKPFILCDWQFFIGGSIFGWKQKATDLRRFRRAYVETAKGSGKTPLAAAIGFYMLVADKEQRAEVYAAASDKDQAEVMFRDAVAMYEQSPALSEILLPRGKVPNVTNLSYLKTNSFFRPLSREAAAKSGKRTSCGLVDEFHEHPDGAVVDRLQKDFKFRKQPLLFIITNSGNDLFSACGVYHTMAQKVASGEKQDDALFTYICGLDEEDDPWTDRRCWPKANPNLGITISNDYIEDEIRKAENIPALRSEVERLIFCIWTDAEGAWIAKKAWLRLRKEFEIEEFEGRKAYIGLDLSRKQDLTSMSVAIENGRKEISRIDKKTSVEEVTNEPCFLVFNEFWLPERNIRTAEDRDGMPYSIYADQGHLSLTAGAAVKMSFVARRLQQMAEIFDVQGIFFDAYAIDLLEDELEEINLETEMFEHPQGFRRSADSGLWMPSSIERTEELIDEERLHYKHNPLLTSCVSNAAFERDAQDNRKLSKRKATGRIDGAVAMVMACGAAINPPERKKKSTYLNSGEMVFLD